jgi:hypothetical protein
MTMLTYYLQLHGSSNPMQHLLHLLKVNEIVHDACFDDNNRLTHLFMSHPEAIELYRKNSDVVTLDCTYKTNRFRMPLLNMVGSTGMNTTFQIAVCFQRGETEKDYMYSIGNLAELLPPEHYPRVFVIDRELALYNALRKIFPRSTIILCRWHVNKNILTNCRPCFPNDNDEKNGGSAQWDEFNLACNTLLSATTPTVYEEQLVLFKHKFPTKPVDYVINNWLTKYKEMIVRAWVDRYETVLYVFYMLI